MKQLELVDHGRRGNHLPATDLLTHTGVLNVAAPKGRAADKIVVRLGCGSDADIPIEAPEPNPPTAPRQIIITLSDVYL